MRAPIDIAKPHCMPKPPKPPIVPITTPEVLEKMRDLSEFQHKDANKDDGLTKEEMYGKADSWMEGLTNTVKHAAADSNHDGKVNADEYLAGKKAEREKASKIKLPGLDTGLGKLIQKQVEAHHQLEDAVGHKITPGNALESLGEWASKLDD